MSVIAYTVSAVFSDAAVADEWIQWLRGGHIAEVIAGGASDAEIIEKDVPPDAARAIEVRYHFPSRERFSAYERERAPRLRAEGLRRFPTERGVTYDRSVGEVVGAFRGSVS